MSAWLFVAAAIALEVTGTFLLKLSDGFAKWHWGLLSIACHSGCF
jgi:small multidrug resistance pump